MKSLYAELCRCYVNGPNTSEISTKFREVIYSSIILLPLTRIFLYTSSLLQNPFFICYCITAVFGFNLTRHAIYLHQNVFGVQLGSVLGFRLFQLSF